MFHCSGHDAHALVIVIVIVIVVVTLMDYISRLRNFAGPRFN